METFYFYTITQPIQAEIFRKSNYITVNSQRAEMKKKKKEGNVLVNSRRKIL